MADRVINENQIMLNGSIFPVIGGIREYTISQFPGKILTGEPDYANEQVLSNWIISDQRGGLLVEEMDESIHQDRFWWSTCNTRERGSIMLPRLATAVTTVPTINTGYLNPTGTIDATSVWTNETQAYNDNDGDYASDDGLKGQNEWTDPLVFTLPYAIYCDKIRFNCSHLSGTQDMEINLDAWCGNAWNDVYQGAITIATSTEKAVSPSAWVSKFRIALRRTGVGQTVNYIIEVDANRATAPTVQAYPQIFCNFNGQLYAAFGNHLGKLNTTSGTAFDFVASFPTTITDLWQDGTNLFIFLGTTYYYWYMSTSDVCGETDKAYDLGIYWDSKRFGFNKTTNVIYYLTNAATTAVTESAKGTIPGLLASDTQRLKTYFDANGDDIIYASTKEGTFAHDYDTATWLQTELKLNNQPTSGKGFAVFQSGLFISCGLQMFKYVSAATATITEMGLDQDDSLPQLRSGEIVKLIEDNNNLFALLDSTYEGTGSRSLMLGWDKTGWTVWWEATANNKNMYDGIVSNAKSRRLWWSTTDSAYFIPLPVNDLNPKKVTGSTFETPAVHITPRFDAGTKAFPKLAVKLTAFLDDMSEDETVTITYQIDQAQGVLTSAWTTLMTAQTSDGKKEVNFGSSAGIVFYDIQFRAALARAAGTNTNSPIIKGLALSYLKLLGFKKAWQVRISIAEAGLVGKTQKQLLDALATILTTQTLMTFTFRDGSVTTDTHYVFVQPYQGLVTSGANFQSTWDLTLVEP